MACLEGWREGVLEVITLEGRMEAVLEVTSVDTFINGSNFCSRLWEGVEKMLPAVMLVEILSLPPEIAVPNIARCYILIIEII